MEQSRSKFFKVGVAHYTFSLESAKSWDCLGHPGHPPYYGPVEMTQPLREDGKILEKSTEYLELYILK